MAKKLIAVWGTDYDIHEDKIYDRPVCPKCKAPFGKYKDEKYRCFSCGKVVHVENEAMKKWFADREGEKVEIQKCFKCKQMTDEVHYIKNNVTLEWQPMGGHCTNCGLRWIA